MSHFLNQGKSGGHSPCESNESASQWFGLSGHRLAGKPAKQGIYIRDGKKFIVK